MSAPQPLFILCPGRSFSSVVSAAIGQHPGMFGLPEVNLFFTDTLGELIDLDVPFMGLPGALIGLKRALAELMRGEQSEDAVREAEAWLRARRDMTGREVFDALRAMAAPRRLVDKSPINTQPAALGRLLRAYPDASFLHLTRHPRSTGRSRAKVHEGQRRRGRVDVEQLWTSRHQELIAFGARLRPGQIMTLTGEWFFEEPTLVLSQVCEWLGLDASEAAVAAMLRPEESPFAREGPPSARLGNNPGFIENPRLRVGPVRPENLDDPLEWADGGDKRFGEDTRGLAAALGYAE